MVPRNRGSSNYRGKKPYKKPLNYNSRGGYNSGGSSPHQYNNNRSQRNNHRSWKSNSGKNDYKSTYSGSRDYQSGSTSPYANNNSGSGSYYGSNSYLNGSSSPYSNGNRSQVENRYGANGFDEKDDEEEEAYDPAKEPERNRSTFPNQQNAYYNGASNLSEIPLHDHIDADELIEEKPEVSPYRFTDSIIRFLNKNLKNYSKERPQIPIEVDKQQIEQKIKHLDEQYLAVIRGVLVNIKEITSTDVDLNAVREYGDKLVLKKIVTTEEHQKYFRQLEFLVNKTLDAFNLQTGKKYEGISKWAYDEEMDKMKKPEETVDFDADLFDKADFEDLNKEQPVDDNEDLPDFEALENVYAEQKNNEGDIDEELPDFEDIEDESPLFLDSEPGTQQSENDKAEDLKDQDPAAPASASASASSVPVAASASASSVPVAATTTTTTPAAPAPTEIIDPVDDIEELADYEDVEAMNAEDDDEIVEIDDPTTHHDSTKVLPDRPKALNKASTESIHLSPLTSRSLPVSIPTGPKSKPTGPLRTYSHTTLGRNSPPHITSYRTSSRSDDRSSYASKHLQSSGYDSFRPSGTIPRLNSGSPTRHIAPPFNEPTFSRRSLSNDRGRVVSEREREIIEEKARKRRKQDIELLAGLTTRTINGSEKDKFVVPSKVKLNSFMLRIESQNPFQEIKMYHEESGFIEPTSVSRKTMPMKEKYRNRIRELCK